MRRRAWWNTSFKEPRPSAVVVQQALDVEVVLHAHFLKPFAHGRRHHAGDEEVLAVHGRFVEGLLHRA